MNQRNIAIACQGGGSHAAFAAGALAPLLNELEDKKFRLVGISGTSGGAICALLAWYGLLQGGPARACEKLDEFWQANSAQQTGELAWNDAAMKILESINYDIQFSPYVWPLRNAEQMLTTIWPALANALGPFNVWGRAEYFQLGPLIAAHVNFNLIGALGKFCSTARHIERWKQADLFSGISPGLDGATKPWLEHQIRLGLGMKETIMRVAEESGEPFTSGGLLYQAFAAWAPPPPGLAFNLTTLNTLQDQVRQVMRNIPQLLFGAVDVGDGEFTAFSSERSETDGGISLEAVRASAALPWLFEAVAIERTSQNGPTPHFPTRHYWDGLLSQNPPIKNFLSDRIEQAEKEDGHERPLDQKPHEIWVLQINPSNVDPAILRDQIWDRRNELAGNLSLNQEISFIGAINKRFAKALVQGRYRAEPNDRHVQVHRIVMDSAMVEHNANRKLGAWSKFDRGQELKDILVKNGRCQANDFLRMRRPLLDACNDLKNPANKMPLDEPGRAALAALAALQPMPGEKGLRLFIDETFQVPPAKGEATPAGHNGVVTVRWYAIGLNQQDQPLRIEGESDFNSSGGALAVRAIRITDVEPIPQAASAQMPLIAPAQPRQDAAMPAPLH